MDQNPQAASVIGYKARGALRDAQLLFDDAIDWAEFYRKVLGIDGIVHRVFPRAVDYMAFEKTDEYREITRMLHTLRTSQQPPPAEEREEEKTITVRMPESLHCRLKEAARQDNISMNKWCIHALADRLGDAVAPKIADGTA